MIFGKLPAHGDFIARGLTDAQVARLDDYLSASLSDAAMLEDFDALYPITPAWRFIIDLDGQVMCGVIAPSIDKVGRQYPVMAGVAADGGSVALMIDACEANLYNAFSAGQTADELFTTLSTFPRASDSDAIPDTGWFLEDEEKFIVDRLDGSFPAGLMTRMLETARQFQ